MRALAKPGTDVAAPAATDAADARPARIRSTLPAAGLLVAIAYGAAAQGAFYAGQFHVLQAMLVATIAAAVLAARPPLPVLKHPALAATALVTAATLGIAAAHGTPQGAVPTLSLLGTLAAAALGGALLDDRGRGLLLTGVVGAGCMVALAGIYGVALRSVPMAMPAQGLMRASSTLTYANAAASFIAVAALLALARTARARADHESPAPAAGFAGALRPVVLVILFTGLGATLSRAGLLAFAAGLVALTVAAGIRPIVAAAAGPAAGSLVAMAGLAPSMPVAGQPRPGLAAAGVAAGCVLAWQIPRAVDRASRASRIALAAGAIAVITLSAIGPLSSALPAISERRLTVASENRLDEWRATAALVAMSPVTGVGPGRFHLSYTTDDGRSMTAVYAHNEYLQVAAEQGLVGAAAMLVALATIARAVLRRRRRGDPVWLAATAALTAIAVHSAFDFVWHIPVIPVIGAALVGVATPWTRTEQDVNA